MIKLELEKEKHEIKGNHIFLSLFFLLFIVFPALASFSYFYIVSPVGKFPSGSIIEIEKGDSLKKIGKKLENAGIIRSGKVFSYGNYFFKNKTLKSGKYSFDKKLDTWGIFEKLSKGEGVIPDDIKFIIKEGEPNWLIAKHLAKKMKNIEEDDFIAAAKEYEGEMYPNTYNLNPKWDAKSVVSRFRKEFQRQLDRFNIKLSKETKKEILIKASLIESEAGVANYETKRHVAGIIENRLKKNMNLQIDAVFFYIFKDSIKNRRVLKRHLKVDSRYNTYKYSGLPPSPISNPSIWSIRAALNPMKTNDLYYITGKDGIFYYAKTGVKHNLNVKKYLRNYIPKKEDEIKKEGEKK